MKNYFLILSILTTFLFAAEDKEADCIILKEENSIICKYSHVRINEEKSVTFNWIEPDGVITRTRVMNIPAGHGSVYDYRYLKSRTKGEWTFQAIDAEEKIETKFIVE